MRIKDVYRSLSKWWKNNFSSLHNWDERDSYDGIYRFKTENIECRIYSEHSNLYPNPLTSWRVIFSSYKFRRELPAKDQHFKTLDKAKEYVEDKIYTLEEKPWWKK